MASAKTVELDKKVPNFSVDATDGVFSLDEHKGKTVVIYFYPKDMTSGCTREGHDFTKLLPKFKAAKAVIYGASRDTMASHHRFIEKECFKLHLLSDPEEKICKLFDVIKDKNMYGRKVRGIERSTFVIDSQGILRKEWRKVKVDGHADEVLEYVKTLKG